MFIDVDLDQVQPGMSKDQVMTVLGSPDTTSTIGGDAYYYISTTQKSLRVLQALGDRPQGGCGLFQSASHRATTSPNTGSRTASWSDYSKGETPARGKDLGVLEQIFGNISQRKMFKDQTQGGTPGGIPGGGP